MKKSSRLSVQKVVQAAAPLLQPLHKQLAELNKKVACSRPRLMGDLDLLLNVEGNHSIDRAFYNTQRD